MSANVQTNFPPQTYSSTFYLNATGDDHNACATRTRRESDGSTSSAVFDCFMSKFLSNDKRTTGSILKKSSAKTANEQCLALGELWKPWHLSTDEVLPGQTEKQNNISRIWRKSAVPRAANTTENNFNRKDEMSLLQFLAINALDLTAPASDVLLKSKNNQWFQLSGHPDSLAPAGPGTVWKKRSGGPDDTERAVYEDLSRDPLLRDIVPKYFREVDYQGEKFIELQNLLYGFQDPYVVDIKMGTRTFLESEVKKTTARNDLYQKMISIDPKAPTEEEHRLQAVTKLRYMQFREQQSSTCSQGFRIEAMKVRGAEPVTDLKKVKSRSQVVNFMSTFLSGRPEVRDQMLPRLYEIRHKFEQSDYFKSREIVGSSIFMIYDDHKVGVWVIDFAKTIKVTDGTVLTHRQPWKQGNHEEGFLFGLDQLISVVEEVKPVSSKPHEDQLSTSLKTVPVVV